MPGHTHFDESTEEYLEAVYRLEREGPGVTTSGLAADLGVSPASVSGMLKKLGSDGYLTYEARGQAALTEKGLRVAVRVIRRNRLAEVFLQDILGMPWDEVHAEACRLYATKLLGARAGYDACLQSVLTHGGMGYAKEFHVERLLREVIIARLAPVSEQMILSFIGERVLNLPRSY